MNKKVLRPYFALFALPTFICFMIGFVVPFGLGIYLSFCEFTTVRDAHFVGFKNYKDMFDDRFVHSLWYTAVFAIVSVITINFFAFCIAMLLTKGIRGTNVFRTVFFMPNLIGGIVLGYIWQLILNGVLDRFMDTTLTFSETYGFWGLIILMNWQQIGYMMIIYIAGIQNVPGELLEAAKIDGATNGQVLRKVILPMVMPSITICTFLTLTNSFKLFDQNLALTDGEPMNNSELLALNIYKTFYGRTHYEGIGQAKAVMFFFIVGAIAVTQLILTHRKEVQQ